MGFIDTTTGKPATPDQIAQVLKRTPGLRPYIGPAQFKGKPIATLLPKTKTEAITDAATLPLFLYGGPEAAEGAGLAERLGAGALRAGVTGAEGVGSDLVQGIVRKLEGRPSGLTPKGEAERFAVGAAAQPALELGAKGLGRLTGLTGAENAAKEATAARSKALTENAAEYEAAGNRLGAENVALKRLRATLGGTAPEAEPKLINRETRAAQDALSHSRNVIHQSINQQWDKLLAPHRDIELPEGATGDAAANIKSNLQADGRWAKLTPQARGLIDDAIRQGGGLKQMLGYDVEGKPIGATEKILNEHPDAILRAVGYEEPILSGMSKEEMRGEAYKALGDGPVEIPVQPKPFKVGSALTLNSRASAILRSPSANAESKGAARDVSRLIHSQFDNIHLLSPAEQIEHQRLRGETRSFYNDFGALSTKGQTPADIGEKLFSQPPHVIQRIIESASPEERESLRRSFADSVLPVGKNIEDAIPKLAQADQDGTLKRLYPGRYGKLTDWTSTAAAQQRLEQDMTNPQAQAAAVRGMRQAMSTPEGRAFMDRMAKLKLKSAQEAIGKLPTPGEAANAALNTKGRHVHFMMRWIGLYMPLESLAGVGMMKHDPVLAATAFATFAGQGLFHFALANDAWRAHYLAYITNPNVQIKTYRLARLAMGIALGSSVRSGASAMNSCRLSSALKCCVFSYCHAINANTPKMASNSTTIVQSCMNS